MNRLILIAMLTVVAGACSEPDAARPPSVGTISYARSPESPTPPVLDAHASPNESRHNGDIQPMTFVPQTTKPIGDDSAATADPDARVLIVSFDGLRPDAIDATTAPTLQGLIDGGSYHAAALAEIPAVTLPNHTSMVTGLSILSHGVFVNIDIEGRVQHPTIFDVAREHGVSAGFFVNKGKLGYLCAEGDTDIRRIRGDVDEIADECAAAIRDNDLHLIFLHFGEPDGAGHSQGWMTDAYLAQVTRADAALSRILDALQERGLRDKTLLIVTADHGGHDKTHGFPIPTDQHVPFILNGPDIAPGRSLTSTLHPMDVAATALTQLGLPTTIAREGRDVTEARIDYAPPENVMEDPAILFGSLCGPVPWMFLTITLVGMQRMRRRSHR